MRQMEVQIVILNFTDKGDDTHKSRLCFNDSLLFAYMLFDVIL